jgi:dephospho-CoA kinase
MKVIGLAGRAGSGKSAVARLLAQRPGIAWVDLDRVAWDTYAPGTATYMRLIEAFGEDIRSNDGTIDRARLARRAFDDPEGLETLNAIIHPAVSEAVETIVQDHRERGTQLLLVEGALLASSPYVDRSIYDEIVWLEVPEPERARRLQASGRAHHESRGRAVRPQGAVNVVSALGTIDQVAARLLAVIGRTEI